MELIYIWIDKYRTFNNTGVSLSDKFKVQYDFEKNTIIIKENPYFYNIFPDNILNVSAILGKNAAGKSNLLDLIGMKLRDRNNLSEEFEIKYSRPKEKFGVIRYPQDIEEERKNSQYFFIYYIGKDSNGESLYCFEGNDIEQYGKLIENKENIDFKYYKSKYWFSFICYSEVEKLRYNATVQDTFVNHTEILSLKENSAIILLREKYNPRYFDNQSFVNEDEYKIAVPRRVAKFTSDFLYKKIEFLIKQMSVENRSIYADDHYTLNIRYANDVYDYSDENLNICGFKNIKGANVTKKEAWICELLSSFYFHFINSIGLTKREGDLKVSHLKERMPQLNSNEVTYQKIKKYYDTALNVVAANFFEGKSEEFEFFFKRYTDLVGFLEKLFLEVSSTAAIEINENYIEIKINSKIEKEPLLKLIELTIDEPQESEIKQKPFSVFQNFFSFDVRFLSDGELGYLGLMSIIDEQITVKLDGKNHFILLLDEPETRMHPELARTFIKTLLDFLGQYKNKTFQIILASHSPFLVSDIPKAHVLTVEKSGFSSIVQTCTFDTFAQNVHVLLRDAFFMNATLGAYSHFKIEEVKECLDNGTASDLEMIGAEYIVNKIGEPVIKSMLQEKLRDKKKGFQTIELTDAIKKYNNLSSTDKEALIKHIINSQNLGD
ncbi:AAA family ATPase [Lysinibacillus sp. FSL M8-0355]|uniref:AAA family ATPase n=1 Tax=Lysinibacillus sp. FSL M8-0355 TaxID=2921719 RepID=UPI0030F8FDE4